MSDKMRWQCPCCLQWIEAPGPGHLFWEVRKHIKEHEDRAALKAVNDAEHSCSSGSCGIGKRTLKDMQGLPILTDYDKGFLRTMHVGWEKESNDQNL